MNLNYYKPHQTSLNEFINSKRNEHLDYVNKKLAKAIYQTANQIALASVAEAKIARRKAQRLEKLAIARQIFMENDLYERMF